MVFKLTKNRTCRNEGVGMVETIKYEVVREIGKVVRSYPKIVVAKVEDSSDAFNLLYRFITGENRQKTKLKKNNRTIFFSTAEGLIKKSSAILIRKKINNSLS